MNRRNTAEEASSPGLVSVEPPEQSRSPSPLGGWTRAASRPTGPRRRQRPAARGVRALALAALSAWLAAGPPPAWGDVATQDPDADGDGVSDADDRCARTAEGCQVDAHGCPIDADEDRVCDNLDACPGSQLGCRIDASGCTSDEDGDGVCDGTDRCPSAPAGLPVSALGCPVLFDRDRASLVLEGVSFEPGSDRLTPESLSVLDTVAAMLGESSDLLQVEGHTDATGDDDYNMSLSVQRAEAVRAYLVARGVQASRLSAKGYGETKPVADNGSENGRARNRRVVLARLERE